MALTPGATALAQTATGQFAVRSTVVNSCTVTAADINFGNYVTTAASTASTGINLQCTKGAAATVALDGGGTGNAAARAMTGPATLTYQLYTNAALTTAINTTTATFTLTSAQNTGAVVVYTVYGQVPAGQSVPAGAYTDTIHITVSF